MARTSRWYLLEPLPCSLAAPIHEEAVGRVDRRHGTDHHRAYAQRDFEAMVNDVSVQARAVPDRVFFRGRTNWILT